MFPEKEILFPKHILQNYDELHIETHIKVFEDEVIEIDQSGLTTLYKIYEFKSMLLPGSKFKSQYLCGKNPGLFFQFSN